MNDEKSKYLIVNGFWLIDGNYFSKKFCNNDLKLAEQYSKTLHNCFGCVDCVNCINCNHCVACKDCEDCKHCFGCKNCDKCNYCANCDDCSGCENTSGANCLKIPQYIIPMQMQTLLPQR